MSAMTLRLPDELNAKLRLVADVLDLSVTDVVREAVQMYCALRLKDPQFIAEAREHVEAMSKLIAGEVGDAG